MSWPITCTLLGWAGWAPGIATPEQWRDWRNGKLALDPDGAPPPVSFIPALQRRRLSRLSRLSLTVAYDCAAGNHSLPTVFASRHGEIYRTQGLLTDLAAGEPLSPMAFSLSVHNTASGLYAICSGNTAPSTAIAAGRDTLAMAFIEAAGVLLQHPEVLLVFADEPLPPDYASFTDEHTVPFGLALRLGRASTTSDQTLSLTPASSEISNASESSISPLPESMGLSVLRWLGGDETHLHTQGHQRLWCWSHSVILK